MGDTDYSLVENPTFDPSLLAHLDEVARWLERLEPQIDAEIEKHLREWCEWTRQKELVGIDVSWLIDKRQIQASYAYEDWGDLGVEIVITNGKITGSYAGD